MAFLVLMLTGPAAGMWEIRKNKRAKNIKIKKWKNGSQNDKLARWRTSRCPWERLLHDQWKAKGRAK